MDQQLRFVYAFPVYNDAGSHYTPHAHLVHELVLVHNGRLRSRVGDEERVAVQGDILFYTARTVHEEWVESKATVMTWACYFEGGNFESDEPFFRKDKSGKVQTLMAELSSLHYYSLSGAPRSREQECMDTLNTLINELHRAKPREISDIIEDSETFIRDHLAQSFTVEDLAEHVGFSRCHFSELYRDATGQTPWHDIQRIRMEEAKRLIETTNLPLREIAPKVGIANEYHLSRLLKSLLGVGVRDLRHSPKNPSIES